MLKVRLAIFDDIVNHLTPDFPGCCDCKVVGVCIIDTIEISNSAIHGAPACIFSPSSPAVVTRLGHNASNDTSCGFDAVGDVEGTSLALAALAPVADSQAHVPEEGSPLIDAAELNFCLLDDQVHTARPMDGDDSGSAECDLGAIEVPEPSAEIMLLCALCGVQFLAVRRQRRGRPGESPR